MTNKEIVRRSLDFTHYRTQALIWFALTFFPIVLILTNRDNIYFVATFAFLMMVEVSLASNAMYKIINMNKHVEDYTFESIVLKTPLTIRFKTNYYFSVSFKGNLKKKVQIKTNIMFQKEERKNHSPSVPKYNNKEVYIGYNKKTTSTIVIDKENGSDIEAIISSYETK